MRFTPVFGACIALAVLTPAAVADSIELSGDVSVVSEYRFRGLSLSDKDPALQGSINASMGNFTVGAWGSSVANSVVGADAEIDIVAGYGFELSETLSLSVGGTAYLYAGGGDLDYGELNAVFTYAASAFDVSLGLAYVPSQANSGNRDNTYIFSSVNYPVSEKLGAFASLAYEDGAFGDGKWDWSLGASYDVGFGSVRLSYVDTNKGGIGAAGVVGGISVAF